MSYEMIAALAGVVTVLAAFVGVYVKISTKIAVNETKITTHEEHDNERITRIELATEKNTESIGQLAIQNAETNAIMNTLVKKLDRYISD